MLHVPALFIGLADCRRAFLTAGRGVGAAVSKKEHPKAASALNMEECFLGITHIIMNMKPITPKLGGRIRHVVLPGSSETCKIIDVWKILSFSRSRR